MKEFEARKHELDEFERRKCEVYLDATDEHKVSWWLCVSRRSDAKFEVPWVEFKVKCLKNELRRLQRQWEAVPEKDTKRKFEVASEQYWLFLQLKGTEKALGWARARSSPAHATLWRQVSISQDWRGVAAETRRPRKPRQWSGSMRFTTSAYVSRTTQSG